MNFLPHSSAKCPHIFFLWNITSSVRCQTARKALQTREKKKKKILLSWDCHSHCSYLYTSHHFCKADKTVTDSSSTHNCLAVLWIKAGVGIRQVAEMKYNMLSCCCEDQNQQFQTDARLQFTFTHSFIDIGSSFCRWNWFAIHLAGF